MHLLESLHLSRDGVEPFGDFVLDVEPSRGQDVHLDDSIAVVLEGAGRHEAAPLLGDGDIVAEASGQTAYVRLSGRVVGVGLAVRDEAGGCQSRGDCGCDCDCDCGRGRGRDMFTGWFYRATLRGFRDGVDAAWTSESLSLCGPQLMQAYRSDGLSDCCAVRIVTRWQAERYGTCTGRQLRYPRRGTCHRRNPLRIAACLLRFASLTWCVGCYVPTRLRKHNTKAYGHA